MTARPPLDRLAALIARAEERRNCSYELAQVIGESLLHAREATWRSRQLLAQRHVEQPREPRSSTEEDAV